MRFPIAHLAATALAFVGLAGTAVAQTEDQLLTASEDDAQDRFGASVSVSGDRALIGAIGDDGIGAVYVFEYVADDWLEQARLTPAGGQSGDAFGTSVSLDGDRAIVGAPGDDAGALNSGAAYVFDFNGAVWSQTAKLKVATPTEDDAFGESVGLDGDRALVGAVGDDGLTSNSGAAFVFEYNGASWSETATLKAAKPDGEDDTGGFDSFGASVALDGDRALVGSRNDDDSGGSSGSAYVFERSGSSWAVTAKLVASDASSSDNLGATVSLSGPRALVGAPGADGSIAGAGAAYVFDLREGTWSQASKLQAEDGELNSQFGSSVALSEYRILIGAPEDEADVGTRTNVGAAYLFDLHGGRWVQVAKYIASVERSGDRLGFAVGLNASQALAGAYEDDTPSSSGGTNAGTTYAYDLPPGPVAATSSTAEGWRLLSVPVGATVADLTGINLVGGVQNDASCDDPATEPLTLYTGYDGGQTTGGSTGYVTPETYADALTPGAGFFWYFYGSPTQPPHGCGAADSTSTAQPLPVTLSLAGTPASTDQTVTITDADRVTSDDPFYLGGNAFAEDVDLGETALTFVTATDQDGPVELQNQVQVYDPDAAGYVILSPAEDAGASATDDLAVWQGAWLERTDPGEPSYPLTLTYDAGARTGAQAAEFYGRTVAGVTAALHRVRFEIRGTVGGEGVFDGAAAVVLAPGAAEGWDAWDGSKLGPLRAPFVLLAPRGLDRDGQRTEKAAESLPADAPAAVSLRFYASGAGSFELSWPELTGFGPGWAVELRDAETGARVDLTGASTYAFTSGPLSDWDDRFTLSVVPPGVVSTVVDGGRGPRLLGPPAAGMTVDDLAAQNLVRGVPGYYPDHASPTLYTAYDPVAGQWVPSAGTGEALPLGRAFLWLMLDRDAGDPAVSASRALPFALWTDRPANDDDVLLELTTDGNRFNVLANPFGTDLDLTGVAGWPGAGSIRSPLYVYDPATASWEDAPATIGPWQGFRFRAGAPRRNGNPRLLMIPASARVEPGATVEAPAPASRLTVGLEAETAEGRPLADRALTIAFEADAGPGFGDEDVPKLRPHADAYAVLATQAGGRLAGYDARPWAPAEIPLALAAPGAGRRFALTWDASALPAGLPVTLVDLETGVEVDVRARSSLAFEASPSPAGPEARSDLVEAHEAADRFVLRIGDRVEARGGVSAVELSAPRPNPTRGAARVAFAVPEAGPARLHVIDVRGREVAVLVEGHVEAGRHEMGFDASALAAGVYVVRLEAAGQTLNRRAVVVR